MCNIKKRDFFNVITGEPTNAENYGTDASIFKKTDNTDLIFDSRGVYLGLRTCRGKFINGKYTSKQGIRDFKSADDLRIWAVTKCANVDFIETGEGNFMQIKKDM